MTERRIELEEKREEDRLVEKNFKQNFADAGDLVELLFKMMKHKRPKLKIPLVEETFPLGADHSGDPFASVDAEFQRRQKIDPMSILDVPDVLDFVRDRPPALPESVWERFWDLRRTKIASEAEVSLCLFFFLFFPFSFFFVVFIVMFLSLFV